MPRYRANVGVKPIGPWRAHREVALVDAVEAGETSMDPDTGRIFSGTLTSIETNPADEPSTKDEDVLAAAVDTLHTHGNRAPVYAREQAIGFERQPERAERWRRIGREAERLLRRAETKRAKDFGNES